MGKKDQGLATGRERYQVVPRVLVFLRNGADVLLLKGAPDKRIWANLYNGIGGHVESGEDIYSAARRELMEECGQDVPFIELKAIANIDAGQKNTGIMIFVFTGWTDDRATVSSGEGDLAWIPVNALPYDEMVEDLPWLLPRIMQHNGEEWPIFIHYHYDTHDRLIIREARRRAGSDEQ